LHHRNGQFHGVQSFSAHEKKLGLRFHLQHCDVFWEGQQLRPRFFFCHFLFFG
jgi:hypothetical protein